MLRPYWITTNQPMSLGYGVTARSSEDAEVLLRLVLTSEHAVTGVVPVDSVDALDQGHVVPNMGNLLRRGIWYPRGYDHLTR